MLICKKCNEMCLGYFPGEKICADCYWDEDSERKAKLRNDPKWVFDRIYSVAIQLLRKTPEEAIQIATAEVERRFK